MTTQKEMRDIMSGVFEECDLLLDAGQREYAGKERPAFANFERIAERTGLSREAVLLVFLEKHMDGIHNYNQGHVSQREDISGRINDAIVYLCLLRGMSNESAAGEPAYPLFDTEEVLKDATPTMAPCVDVKPPFPVADAHTMLYGGTLPESHPVAAGGAGGPRITS